jgi:acyl carrier protein
MIGRESMIDNLKKCLVEVSDAEPSTIAALQLNDSLVEKGVLDSLSAMKFVLAIERELGVQINFNKINSRNFATLEKIEKFVRKLQ